MALDDSKLIFEQLRDADSAAGGGVHTIIENHDAWSNNGAILNQLELTLRAQLSQTSRAKTISQRIARQQNRLQSLVTVLPKKLPATA